LGSRQFLDRWTVDGVQHVERAQRLEFEHIRETAAHLAVDVPAGQVRVPVGDANA
jgi:hypothetical protein